MSKNSTKQNPNERPAHWMPRVGDIVDYHSIIGEKITSTGHKVRAVQMSDAGYPVAWLEGKSGCVHVDALTPTIRKQRTEFSPAYPGDGDFVGGYDGSDN